MDGSLWCLARRDNISAKAPEVLFRSPAYG
jgi:hypothetical protein